MSLECQWKEEKRKKRKRDGLRSQVLHFSALMKEHLSGYIEHSTVVRGVQQNSNHCCGCNTAAELSCRRTAWKRILEKHRSSLSRKEVKTHSPSQKRYHNLMDPDASFWLVNRGFGRTKGVMMSGCPWNQSGMWAHGKAGALFLDDAARAELTFIQAWRPYWDYSSLFWGNLIFWSRQKSTPSLFFLWEGWLFAADFKYSCWRQRYYNTLMNVSPWRVVPTTTYIAYKKVSLTLGSANNVTICEVRGCAMLKRSVPEKNPFLCLPIQGTTLLVFVMIFFSFEGLTP